MRHVELDFLRKRPRPPLSAWALLVVGIGLLVLTVLRHQFLDGEITREEGLALKMKADSVQSGGRDKKTEATRQITHAEVKARLAMPWGTLFDKLERTRTVDIALLSVEADEHRREASITAEASNVEDMLAYLERLKKVAGTQAVFLHSHKIDEEDPQRPVRFVLRLKWRQ